MFRCTAAKAAGYLPIAAMGVAAEWSRMMHRCDCAPGARPGALQSALYCTVQVADLSGTVSTELSTPSLTALGVPDLTQGWIQVAASADRRRVTVQLQADIPGRYYTTQRLLGRKVPCISSSTAEGADALIWPVVFELVLEHTVQTLSPARPVTRAFRGGCDYVLAGRLNLSNLDRRYCVCLHHGLMNVMAGHRGACAGDTGEAECGRGPQALSALAISCRPESIRSRHDGERE